MSVFQLPWSIRFEIEIKTRLETGELELEVALEKIRFAEIKLESLIFIGLTLYLRLKELGVGVRRSCIHGGCSPWKWTLGVMKTTKMMPYQDKSSNMSPRRVRSRHWRHSRTGTAVVAVLALLLSTAAWLSLVFSGTTTRCWHRFKDWERRPQAFPWGRRRQDRSSSILQPPTTSPPPPPFPSSHFPEMPAFLLQGRNCLWGTSSSA